MAFGKREKEKNLSEKAPEASTEDVSANYGTGNQQLYSYSALMGVFSLVFVVFLLIVRGLGRSMPPRIDAKDIVLLGMATHKLSLIGTQDAITSPLRAPFTELQEKESSKSVDEKPRGRALQKSIGELLTCKFCLSMWVASFFTYGLILAPRVTRLIATVFAVVTISDCLHQAYKALMQKAQ